jgi:hypothetical protein
MYATTAWIASFRGRHSLALCASSQNSRPLAATNSRTGLNSLPKQRYNHGALALSMGEC